MNKKYGYRKKDIIFPYGSLLLIPISLAFVLLKYIHFDKEPRDVVLLVAYIFLWLLCLSISVPILTWIINNIKVVIAQSDIGISKKDIFREVLIKWNEITKVEKKYLYEGSYNPYKYEAPTDLLIHGVDGKRIQIYKILRNLDGSGEGIAEFEKELYKRIDVMKLPDTVKYQRNQLRLGIVAGLLLIIASIAIGYNPPSHADGLFGLFIRLLGLRGTVIFMIFGGCIIIVYCAYKLRNASRQIGIKDTSDHQP